jgi:hypothetical protein
MSKLFLTEKVISIHDLEGLSIMTLPKGYKAPGPTITKPKHEHYAKLYESQKGKAQDFLKLLSILLGFTFLFFFLILLPYVNLQQREIKTSQALQDINRNIGEKQAQINLYTSVNDNINALQIEIQNSTTELQAYIAKLPALREMSQTPLEIFPNCSNLNRSSDEFITCNVNQKGLTLIAGYNNTIFNKVIIPLQANASKLFNLTSLKMKTNDLVKSFREVSSSLDLSESVIIKETAAEQQNKLLNEYWNEFGSVIGGEINKINPSLQMLLAKHNNLTSEKQQYAAAKGNITYRLNEVQFPVGKLPLGINEAISLFPFGIIAGFIVVTVLFYKSIILRKKYHLDYVRNFDYNFERTGKMISEELPVWIDPLSPWYTQIAKSGVMLIPFVIFLLSWSLIVQSWSLNSSSVAESILFGSRQTNQMVFTISNYVILILFIICYFIIAREWDRYYTCYKRGWNRNRKW